jgi:putative Ca2+/H+ antiporter (TMEM165/GDT1 family)
MNDDIQLLSMLLRYSQRRMVVSLGLVQAHFVADAVASRAVIARLQRQRLVYVEGATVRLTLPGFAQAIACSSHPASVQRLGKPPQPSRSRAA